ncbi:MAG: NAD(P) transhydrogenase subunit alpha [Planctomycetota bacterium]
MAMFVGFEIIARVPAKLHTPLMSGSNAISGISVIGAIMLMRTTAGNELSALSIFVGILAIALGTVNVVGGYLVTDRMLKMFKKK